MQSRYKRPSDPRKGYDPKALNVGIIGCGRIAEHHLRFIARTDGVRLVALSDPIISNAQRFAEKYGVRHVYSSHEKMLDASSLDVVHIVTPPEFHYQQAADTIDRGVHVLLEKPCTLHLNELEDLYRRAEAKGVLLCPDFIQLFMPLVLQASSVIESGQLGRVVHVDIHLSLDLQEQQLREAVGLHWSYNLPGGIFHNNITHPLYLALRWLGDPEQVSVAARSLGILPRNVTDHMVIMLSGMHCTANIVLSGGIKPEPYYVQIFCERGNTLVNFDTSTVIVKKPSILPNFLRRASCNFHQSYQLSIIGIGNLMKYLRGRLVPYQGLENLIPRFYNSVRQGSPPPVSKELALSVARTEEAVFAQAGKLHLDTRKVLSNQKFITHPEKILVTGATGYLGSAVVRRLVEEGYYVRAFVRPLSHVELLEKLGAEVVYGDIRDVDSLVNACKEMDIVIHMAAALKGSVEFMLDCAVKGTQNLAEAAKACELKRVVYISSMSVYDAVSLRAGELMSESSPLEEFPQVRGTYSLAKRLAEDDALSHLQGASPSWTILRPSVIVGNSHDIFSPIGKRIGNLLLSPGSAKKILRLIHVDDVASAIANVVQNNGTRARIFNLSNGPINQQQYIDKFIRKTEPENIRVIYIPYWVARVAVCALTILRPLSRRIPTIHKRRLVSLYQNVQASSEAIKTATGWEPRENLLQTLIDETEASKIVTADQRTEAIVKLATSHTVRKVTLVKRPDDHQATNPLNEASTLSPRR
jgi:predicted dehydrogenase/nucleoside-diphosphate-sugar epimerase